MISLAAFSTREGPQRTTWEKRLSRQGWVGKNIAPPVFSRLRAAIDPLRGSSEPKRQHENRILYTSKFLTSSACCWMKLRLGSTSSPMRIVKISSTPVTSSSFTRNNVRFSGSIVVSHS
jgi:hypothetical protein